VTKGGNNGGGRESETEETGQKGDGIRRREREREREKRTERK
jgi:hypothetical protein